MDNSKNLYILKRLKRAYQEAIEVASDAKNVDIRKWAKWELRKEYLHRQINEYRRLAYGSNIPKRVFISYTKGKGERYYSTLKKKLKTINFTTTNGFQTNKKGSSVVVRNVLDQMATSTIYIGIYTKEFILKVGDKQFWTPSVWTIEEKGMALGLKMPVLLICEEGIHMDFFNKTTGAFKHCIAENFHHFEHEIVNEANDLILSKYLDIKRKHGSEEDFDMFEF